MALDKEKLASLQIDRGAVPQKSTPWAWIVLLILACVVTTAWFMKRGPAVPVVTTVSAKEIGSNRSSGVLNASGYITARRMATVSSKVTAKVLTVDIEEGMRVQAGQILATLDNQNLMADLALAEAQVQAAIANVKETVALHHEAQLSLKRTKDLVAKGFATEAEQDRAQAQADSLGARIEAQQEQIKVAERNVAVWQQQIQDTFIRAPFEGVIVSKDAQPGEMISPVSAGGGFTRTGIGTLVDMSSLEIEVDVNESYIKRVSQNQRVSANLDAYPDWAIACHVIAIIPTADRQKATVEVRIGLDVQDERILPDMGVKVTFHEDETPRTSVPETAAIYVAPQSVDFSGDDHSLWVVHDGKAEKRAIVAGGRDANGVRVLSGINVGDRVIVQSNAVLEQGMLIEVNP